MQITNKMIYDKILNLEKKVEAVAVLKWMAGTSLGLSMLVVGKIAIL